MNTGIWGMARRSMALLWVTGIASVAVLGCGLQGEKQTEHGPGEATHEDGRISVADRGEATEVSLLSEVDPAEEAVESHEERLVAQPIWDILRALGGVAEALRNPDLCTTFPAGVCKTACSASTWIGGRNCNYDKSDCIYSDSAQRIVCQCADASGAWAHTCE